MARSTKTTSKKPASSARKPTQPAPAAPAPAKTKAARVSAPAPTAAVPARVPPPSKGELRAQIEKLEAANAALKAKGREANRAAKLAGRQITELEAEISELRQAAARSAKPARPVAAAKKPRRAAPPRRDNKVDPGDTAPNAEMIQEADSSDADPAADAMEQDPATE